MSEADETSEWIIV